MGRSVRGRVGVEVGVVVWCADALGFEGSDGRDRVRRGLCGGATSLS